MSTNTFVRLRERFGAVVTAAVVVTAALTIPFLAMAPDESASTEPSGDVFTARDRIDERFVSSVHTAAYIAEHDGGDLLRAEPLGELLGAQEELKRDPDIGPSLFRYFEADAESDVVGLVTLADLVDRELRRTGVDGGVSGATDDQVKAAGATVIARHGERSDLLGLSARSHVDADGDWVVPAVTFPVLSDNDVLGFPATSINLGGETEPEEYDRDVQEVLRGAEDFEVHGIAIDINLTSEEQGAVAGPFIGLTVLAVLVIVGLAFRSYWVLATVSGAFLALIVWLKGFSNLVGLEDDLVLSLIVPVAMISFGVDFAFHSVGRYREERVAGRAPRAAFVVGTAAVSSALLLALASDATAFLANVTSGIESIQQFGVGAAIALGSAYLLLGVVTPLVVAEIEATVPPPSPGRRSTVARLAGGLAAASLAMASVLSMVFVIPWLGVVLAAVTVLVTLVLPLALRRRTGGDRLGDLPATEHDARLASGVGRAVAAVARRPAVVLPVAGVVTVLAAVLALRVPAEFDVEDFFSPDTDFVESLDQLDLHVGDRGGEPALLYVEGDLTDPRALATLQDHVDDVRSLDTPSLARGSDGDVEVDGGVFGVLEATWASEPMKRLVAERAGVALTDDDADGIPDTREQLTALLAVARESGVAFDTERLALTPDDVRTAVDLDVDDPSRSATVFELGLVDSRSQESVAAARADLEPITGEMATDLGGTFVQVTGSPFVREASLDATNRALQVSLPVALVLCLVIAGVFLRSVRYGLASIVPILMVVAWLYAFMELAGYAINIVTATIAAVSIGIGIDFAVHFISRYREELRRTGDRLLAVRATGEGTGLALVASAVSSAVGFAILAFAPMPLFAAYGLLTALMIALALVATLAVLPSLLVLVTSDSPHPARTGRGVDHDGRHEPATPVGAGAGR